MTNRENLRLFKNFYIRLIDNKTYNQLTVYKSDGEIIVKYYVDSVKEDEKSKRYSITSNVIWYKFLSVLPYRKFSMRYNSVGAYLFNMPLLFCLFSKLNLRLLFMYYRLHREDRRIENSNDYILDTIPKTYMRQVKIDTLKSKKK